MSCQDCLQRKYGDYNGVSPQFNLPRYQCNLCQQEDNNSHIKDLMEKKDKEINDLKHEINNLKRNRETKNL